MNIAPTIIAPFKPNQVVVAIQILCNILQIQKRMQEELAKKEQSK